MVRELSRQLLAASLTSVLVLNGCLGGPTSPPSTPVTSSQVIQHVVVIFDENESFDHYFGTYPNAKNLAGETAFTAASGTPTPNNYIINPSLLTANPNASNSANGTGAINPFRLPPADAYLYTQSHSYAPEQMAFDNGAMDLFPQAVGAPNTGLTSGNIVSTPASIDTMGLTMGYFDGNTVTALWNYAQHYAISDHFFGTTFGPSTIGAINLISGQTNGSVNDVNASTAMVSDGYGGFTVDVDEEPTGDLCDSTGKYFHMTGKNIGDLLTAANVTWGWFQGGFNTINATNPAITAVTPNVPASSGCHRVSYSAVTGLVEDDYVARHEPFQFYASTANLNHLRPTGTIGTTDAANHQYDTQDFMTALNAGTLPAVSFLKATQTQDSHATTSDPLDEQTWLVTTINAIESSSSWQSTAIIIAYDDSDGWYDHLNDVVNGSNVTSTDSPICSAATGSVSPANALPGVLSATLHAQGRCGHGPRLPLLVISPWANKNYVDSTPIDQTSILRFIEDTFLNSQRIGGGSYDSISGSMNSLFNFTSSTPPNPNVVLLNPTTGVVTSGN